MFLLSRRTESPRGDASQDRLLATRVLGLGWVLAVADGSGEGGAQAAQLAVDAVAQIGPRLLWRDPQAWYRLLRAIDDVLTGEADAGKTSLVALCVTPWRTVGASVGDARARWVGPDGAIDLTGAQSRRPLLGTGDARPVPFQVRTPARGVLVAASGGLWRSVAPGAVDTRLAADPPADPAAALVDLARGPDGVPPADTAVLVLRRG